METRAFECRFEDDGILRGVVIPYAPTQSVIGNWSEQFLSGAFGNIGEVRLNLMHERKQPLAVNKANGGLRLTDGKEALRAEIDLPDTTAGRDARTLIKRGVLSGMSVEFRAIDESWDGNLRTINKAELTGIGLVDRPQYDDAVFEIRQAQEAYNKKREAVELWPLL